MQDFFVLFMLFFGGISFSYSVQLDNILFVAQGTE